MSKTQPAWTWSTTHAVKTSVRLSAAYSQQLNHHQMSAPVSLVAKKTCYLMERRQDLILIPLSSVQKAIYDLPAMAFLYVGAPQLFLQLHLKTTSCHNYGNATRQQVNIVTVHEHPCVYVVMCYLSGCMPQCTKMCLSFWMTGRIQLSEKKTQLQHVSD